MPPPRSPSSSTGSSQGRRPRCSRSCRARFACAFPLSALREAGSIAGGALGSARAASGPAPDGAAGRGRRSLLRVLLDRGALLRGRSLLRLSLLGRGLAGRRLLGGGLVGRLELRQAALEPLDLLAKILELVRRSETGLRDGAARALVDLGL